MAAWAGLGYYSRARNLLKCARLIVAEYNGAFPDEEEALLSLPGIGPYTAAAIAAIAFNRRPRRLTAILSAFWRGFMGLETPLPALKPLIKQKNQSLVPTDRPGDFAQAMMDLGATLCTPKRPNCLICPWHKSCQARHSGIAESPPQKVFLPPTKTEARAQRHGLLALENAKGEVLLHRRPDIKACRIIGWHVVLSVKRNCHRRRGICWPMTARNQCHVTMSDKMPDQWTANLDGTVVHVFTHFPSEVPQNASASNSLERVFRKATRPYLAAPARFCRGRFAQPDAKSVESKCFCPLKNEAIEKKNKRTC